MRLLAPTIPPIHGVPSGTVSDELAKVLSTTIVAGLASVHSHEWTVLSGGRRVVRSGQRGAGGRHRQRLRGLPGRASCRGRKLRFSCSCPVGREGRRLRALRRGDPCLARRRRRAYTDDRRRPCSSRDAPPGRAVNLPSDHAHEDEALARQLLLRAATPASGAAVDVASMRK